MLSHQYPLIRPKVKKESIRMLSLEDIGAMKLNAITDNGTRFKDFMDMYVLLEHYSLQQLLTAYENKYPNVSRQIAVKALNYFDDIQLATIQFTGSTVTKPQIMQRIYEATLESGKIFRL